MLCLTLTAYHEGMSIEFPLKELGMLIDLAYFSPSKTPSMIMFTEETFCCIIVTYKVNINFVGGYTEVEVQYSIIKFFSLISKAMGELYRGSRVVP